MSAVSRKVMPASSAASTTARVRSRSSLPPKLLQPRPTRVTWRPLESSSCEYMLHSLSPMRVWIDITNSPHVLVFRPLIALLRQRGAEVEVTSRDYAQTVQLLELQGIHAEILGAHGGRGRLGKAKAMVSRMRALFAWAQGRRFDVALAHGSHELTLTARRLGIPSATTFDYEFAWLQHQLGCRAATRVVVPEAIPPERLARYGVEEPKLRRYPGLKEEYYLADFEPDPAALAQWEIDEARTLVVVRTPPDVSLYHRRSNPLFPQVLDHLGRDDSVRAIVIPRTPEQRDYVRGLGLPSVLVPDQAADGQSLIAFSDLVVSAGRTPRPQGPPPPGPPSPTPSRPPRRA